MLSVGAVVSVSIALFSLIFIILVSCPHVLSIMSMCSNTGVWKKTTTFTVLVWVNCMLQEHSLKTTGLQVSCITDGEVKAVGETWLSDDLCTTYSCVKNNNVSNSRNYVAATSKDWPNYEVVCLCLFIKQPKIPVGPNNSWVIKNLIAIQSCQNITQL